MPRQSAPTLRKNKKRGWGGKSLVNNNNLLIMFMVLGGIILFIAMSLLYEITKSTERQEHEHHSSIRGQPLVKKPKIPDPGEEEEEDATDSYYEDKQKVKEVNGNKSNDDDAANLDETNDDAGSAGLGQIDDQYIFESNNKQANNNEINENNNNNNKTTTLEIMMANGGLPVLPIFAPVVNGKELMKSTMDGSNPTLAGIIALLQTFLVELDTANRALRDSQNFDAQTVAETFFNVSFRYLKPFDDAFRGRSIFPIREDDSVFLSLAAYREHLLTDTLIYAFTQAKSPNKLFVGVVVQNCFGKVLEDGKIDASGKPCKTGVEVIGKDDQGNPLTKISDAPPDPNGIADFCSDPRFFKYCQNGQIRVLYVHASESLGPAMARYYASKLWGGETYFIQCDSHLQFATHWDDKYITETKATSNFPKSVLSSYPPGFTDHDPDFQGVRETPGARLCNCETIADEPNAIVRINTGSGYRGDEPRPTQIPYIAAGFFFARSEFLVDVPFDPYLPWCFMGEEIALSMRAWTQGWNIYAPRKNLIAHQYRPGRLGLPKFWESVDRFWGREGIIHRVQAKVLKRIKHMVGYPDARREKIEEEGLEVVLTEMDEYGISSNNERSWNEFLEFANMEIDEASSRVICNPNKWCNQGLKY